jgi:UDP-GlcNAc:undecaprenyl-phosphate GlcNAc-1-phosphate transferase
MFIGYVLAVGSIQTSQKSSTAVAILVPIVALGLPIADTLLAMIRRAVHHRPMFSADRAHIHHKLMDLGLTQRQAVLILYGASILLGGTALLLTVASSLQSAAILVAMAVFGFAAIRKLGYGHIRRTTASHADIDARRQLDHRTAPSLAFKIIQPPIPGARLQGGGPRLVGVFFPYDGRPEFRW